jgi:hypothetical protein
MKMSCAVKASCCLFVQRMSNGSDIRSRYTYFAGVDGNHVCDIGAHNNTFFSEDGQQVGPNPA